MTRQPLAPEVEAAIQAGARWLVDTFRCGSVPTVAAFLRRFADLGRAAVSQGERETQWQPCPCPMPSTAPKPGDRPEPDAAGLYHDRIGPASGGLISAKPIAVKVQAEPTPLTESERLYNNPPHECVNGDCPVGCGCARLVFAGASAEGETAEGLIRQLAEAEAHVMALPAGVRESDPRWQEMQQRRAAEGLSAERRLRQAIRQADDILARLHDPVERPQRGDSERLLYEARLVLYRALQEPRP